jgi:hypothetical protein
MRYLVLLLLAGCATANHANPLRLELERERACRAAYTASTGDHFDTHPWCERR